MREGHWAGGGRLSILAGAVIISFAPVFVKISGVGPATAGVYRLVFGGLALVAFALIGRNGGSSSLPGKGRLGLALAAAVLFALDLIFWHSSIHRVGPGLATVLTNFQVFVLAAIGMVFLRERPGARFFIAAAMAMAGIFLLVGTDWRDLGPGYRQGVLQGLLAAVFYGGYLAVLRRVQQGHDHSAQVAGIAVVSLLSAAPMVLMVLQQGESLALPDGRSLLVLLAYGVLCQGGGWMLISRGLPQVPVAVAGLTILMQPMLSFAWDALFFGRPLRLTDIVGAGLALAAIYLGGRTGSKT